MKVKCIIFYLTVLLPIVTTSTSCSKECGAALADLATNIVINGTLTVTAGVPFNVPNVIENVSNTIESCKGDIVKTLSAEKSSSRLKIDFDNSDNGSFGENKLNNNFEVPEIGAGSAVQEDYAFTFDEPGDYRLITFADDLNDVEERDEDNNASANLDLPIGRLSAGNNNNLQSGKKALLIKVLPNPEFERQDDMPFVNLIKREVTFIK